MVHWDFETFSIADIRACGAFRYAEDPTTEVLIMGYALDNAPVQAWRVDRDLFILPDDIEDRIVHGDIFIAHNAQFEYIVWRKVLHERHGWPMIPVKQWYCTAAHAASLKLPRSLEGAGAAARVPIQKDKEGSRLIRLFCMPRKPSKKNPSTRVMPRDAPDEFNKFVSYNITDVESERSLLHTLPPMNTREVNVWRYDTQINERGLPIDTALVRRTLIVVDELQRDIVTQTRALTATPDRPDGIAPTQVAKLLDFVNAEEREENEIRLYTMQRKEVEEQMGLQQFPDKVNQILELRMEGARVSTKKLTRMLNVCGADNRARGTLLYHGAGPGRWCIAEDTLVRVLDEQGKVRIRKIQFVRSTDKVWDGENWVTHGGTVFSGEKEVIEYDGVCATPEHDVWDNQGIKISLLQAQASKRKILVSVPWCVYCLHFPNGKRYIGISSRPHRRYRIHLEEAAKGTPTLIYRAIRKYGAPTQEIWAWYPNKTKAQQAEKTFVYLYGTHGSKSAGYNSTQGGDDGGGFDLATLRRASALGIAALQKKMADPVWRAAYCARLSAAVRASSAFKQANKDRAAAKKGVRPSLVQLERLRVIGKTGNKRRQDLMVLSTKPPRVYISRAEKNKRVSAGVKRFFASRTDEEKQQVTKAARGAVKWTPERRALQAEVMRRAKPWKSRSCAK